MSWNGSENAAVPKKAPPQKIGKAGLWHGPVALVAVILIATGVYLFVTRDATKPESDEHVVADKMIREVKPTKVVKPVEKAEEKKTEAPKEKPIRWVQGLKNAALDDQGRVYFVPRPGHKLVTNDMARVKQPYQIFKHGYQNELAAYLTAPPGTMFLGNMRRSDRFVKEVVETMSLPIEDSEDDTPEQRALRQQMREVMKTLQAEVDAGRDVRELFDETRRELQELGRYKQTLESEIKKMYRDVKLSDQDVEDAIDAANKMLEAKGIAPMKFGTMAKKIIQEGRDMGLNSRFDE